MDVEIAWIDSHEDVMAFEERWLAHVLAAVEDAHGEATRETFGTELIVPALSRSRASRSPQAKELLREHGHDAPGAEHDLDPPSERALSAAIERAARARVRVRDRLPDDRAALLPHAPPRPAGA